MVHLPADWLVRIYTRMKAYVFFLDGGFLEHAYIYNWPAIYTLVATVCALGGGILGHMYTCYPFAVLGRKNSSAVYFWITVIGEDI